MFTNDTLCLFVFRRIAGALLGEARGRTLRLGHVLASEMAIHLLAIDAPVITQALDGRRKRAEALPGSVHGTALFYPAKVFPFSS